MIDIISHLELEVTTADLTVGELKHRIQRRLRTPATMQSLLYRGRELVDGERSISEYGLTSDSTLFLVVKGGDKVLGEDDKHDEEESVHDEEEDEADQNQNQNQAQGHGFDAYPMSFNLQIGSRYYWGYAFNNNMLLNGDVVNYWEPADMSNTPVTLHILRSGSADVVTTIDIEWTDTLLYLKREIYRTLGHEIDSQRLDVGGPPLNDRSQIQDIPEIMNDPIVNLTILRGYWFNTY